MVKSGLESPERYWGTYRPGVYFGTRVRHPASIVTGLMWFVPGHFQNNMLAVRYYFFGFILRTVVISLELSLFFKNIIL